MTESASSLAPKYILPQNTLKSYLDNSPEELKLQIKNIYKDSQKNYIILKGKIDALSSFDKYSVLKEKLKTVFRNTDDTVREFSNQQLDKIIKLKNSKNITNQKILDILQVDIGDSKTALKDFGFAFQEAIGMKKNDTDKQNKADGIIGKYTILKFISLVQTDPNKKIATNKTLDTTLYNTNPEKDTKSIDIEKSVEYMKKRLYKLSKDKKVEIYKLKKTRGLYNKKIAEILGFKKIFKEKSTHEKQKKLDEFGEIFQRALGFKNIDKKIGSRTLSKFINKYITSDFLKKIKEKDITHASSIEKKLKNTLTLSKLKSIDRWEIEKLSREEGDKDKKLMKLIQKELHIDFNNMGITPDECARFIQENLFKMKLKTYGYIGNLTLQKIWMRKIETRLTGEEEKIRLDLIHKLEKFDNPGYNKYKKNMKYSSRVPKITENGIKGEEIQNLERRLSGKKSFTRLQERLSSNNKKGLLLDYKTKNLYVVSSNKNGFVYEKVYKTAIGASGHRTPKGMFTMGKMRKGGLGKVLSNEDRMSPAAYNKKFAAQIKARKRSTRKKRKYYQNSYIPSVQSGYVTVSTLFYPIRNGVGVHATNKEQSITMAGANASHGCLRMYHADLIDLYYQNNEKKYDSIAII